ncbi:hypothetical protein Tco_0711166 [Tanacetum coccineum]
MSHHQSKLSSKGVKSLAKKYGIPLDLHPSILPEWHTMDELPKGAIRLYEQFFDFSGGHWFSFEKRVDKCAGDRRAIPNAMTWRNQDSDVNDPLSDDDYSLLDVRTLAERVVDLRLKKLQAARAATKKTENKKRTDDDGEALNPNLKRWRLKLPIHAILLDLAVSFLLLPSVQFCLLSTLWRFIPSLKERMMVRTFVAPTPISRSIPQHAPEGNTNTAPTSPTSSVEESVHNYVDINGGNDKEDSPRIKPFVNQSGQPFNCLLVRAKRYLRGRHVEDGESSNVGAIYDDYSTLAEAHDGCSDTVRKLVTARQDLEHNPNLYTNISNCFKELKEEHSGCDGKVKVLEEERNQLSFVNKAQATQIQELESELVKKGYELKFADHLLQSHEYKKSLSEPFNMAIQAGWGKGLSQGQTDKQIFVALNEVQGFDSYSDMKLYPMYGKLFEAQYPFIAKIASGYLHSVTDMLKIHPDPAPSGSTPALTISTTFAGTGPPPSSSCKKA